MREGVVAVEKLGRDGVFVGGHSGCQGVLCEGFHTEACGQGLCVVCVAWVCCVCVCHVHVWESCQQHLAIPVCIQHIHAFKRFKHSKECVTVLVTHRRQAVGAAAQGLGVVLGAAPGSVCVVCVCGCVCVSVVCLLQRLWRLVHACHPTWQQLQAPKHFKTHDCKHTHTYTHKTHLQKSWGLVHACHPTCQQLQPSCLYRGFSWQPPSSTLSAVCCVCACVLCVCVCHDRACHTNKHTQTHVPRRRP